MKCSPKHRWALERTTKTSDGPIVVCKACQAAAERKRQTVLSTKGIPRCVVCQSWPCDLCLARGGRSQQSFAH